MYTRRFAVITCTILAAQLFGGAAIVPTPANLNPPPDLFSQFSAPPAEARPFVRWWWNGGRINEAEIERQLDVLHAAGIGGVEINTIGMPTVSRETRLEDHPEVAWLSPEWCRLVRIAAEGAHRRGMQADLLVGSGWPLGGRFLPVEQQTQRVRVQRQRVRGPVTLRLSEQELMRYQPPEGEDRGDEVEPARVELLFVRLMPARARNGEFDPGSEHLTTRREGMIEIEVPPGEHELIVGFREWGFTHVKLGAPGADGPVLDHFSAATVRAYLERMAAALAPALGGRLGGHLRALFIDSIELDHANWTDDLPDEFRRRRGYDLYPYLPYVIEPEAAPAASGFDRSVQQARYDFNRTLVELFHERFIGTYVAFCREQGVLSRLQAYGRETHPLHGSMLVDLPEGESWFWPDRSRTDGVLQTDSTAANKLVSSAAHLSGKATVSFEAMTNAVTPFRETLADFKLLADRSFLDGLNHPILHGYNSSPPDAGVPGWVRFGSYVSEHNPWWPALEEFTTYAARIGTVLRHSIAQAEVALLPPQADEWGRFGRLYQPFPEVRHPWYLYDLPRAIQHAGNGTDLVSEQVIQDASVVDGQLRYGPQDYSVVIVMEVDSIAPATLRALIAFARGGGRVVILGAPSSRGSGVDPVASDEAGETDDDLAALSSELLSLGHPFVHQSSPPPFLDAGPGNVPPSHRQVGRGEPLLQQSYDAMIPWSRELLDSVGIEPAIHIDPVSPDLSQVHHKTADADLYFFANRSREHDVRTTLTFPSVSGALWRWNPETGERSLVAGEPAAGIPLVLGPHESVLLVFDRTRTRSVDEQPIRLDAPAQPAPTLQQIDGPWLVELEPPDGGPIETLQLERLQDLSAIPRTADFGGLVRYTNKFVVPDPDAIGAIDLGTVYGLSEVSINGHALGRCWYGRPIFPVGETLKRGENRLVITVRTTLANWVRAQRDDPAAQRWASWYERVPAGLAGPVQLRAGSVP